MSDAARPSEPQRLSYDEIVELIADSNDMKTPWSAVQDRMIIAALKELRQRREDERVAETLISAAMSVPNVAESSKTQLQTAVDAVVKAAETDPYLTADLANAISDLRDVRADETAAVRLQDDGRLKAILAGRLCQWDGVDEPDQLIWEGNPPEPWGPVWMRYEPRAAEILAVMDEARSAEKSGDGYGHHCAAHPGAIFLPSHGCPTCAVDAAPYSLSEKTESAPTCRFSHDLAATERGHRFCGFCGQSLNGNGDA